MQGCGSLKDFINSNIKTTVVSRVYNGAHGWLNTTHDFAPHGRTLTQDINTIHLNEGCNIDPMHHNACMGAYLGVGTCPEHYDNAHHAVMIILVLSLS